MQNLNINEIFYSIQGEGLRIGTPNIFIRLAGCNLRCKFCDTNHIKFKEYNIKKLEQELKQYYPCQNIIWTGGEPTLQLNDDIIKYFKDKNYFQAIETNGSFYIPQNIDFISISPKTKLHKSIIKANEIKILYPDFYNKYILNNIEIDCENWYLSARFNKNKIVNKYVNDCIKIIKGNPKWKLNIQLHKLLNIK